MNTKWRSKQSGRILTIIGDEDGIRYFYFDDMPNVLAEQKLNDVYRLWEEDFEPLPLTETTKSV
jgi:hypothetical protein